MRPRLLFLICLIVAYAVTVYVGQRATGSSLGEAMVQALASLPFLVIIAMVFVAAVFFFGTLFIEGLFSIVAVLALFLLWPFLGRERALGWHDWLIYPVEALAQKIKGSPDQKAATQADD